MRILLSKKMKLKLLEILKQKYRAKTLKKLSMKMKIPFKTVQNWIYTKKKYIPEKIIPKGITLEILDKQEDNWGAVKAGKIGGKKNAELLIKKLGKEGYYKIMQERGKKAVNTLQKRYGIKELTRIAVQGKMKKRENESKMLEKENEYYFINKEVSLDLKEITFTSSDIRKQINFPNKMTPELAEEIGIHLGDGCLSKSRNYFSVKTNKKEEDYVINFLFPLYKKLYNLDLKLMRLESVSGFEIYSKAFCEFKNKSLGIPYGEKVHKIKVPESILKTKDKEIYRAFIRGLFDTDGCISIIKKDYPMISITIKSEELIKKVSEMLTMIGFIVNHSKERININGKVMLEKWIKEIDSNNPVKIEKLRWASRIVDNTQPCGG
jgi:hypothetical protein